MQGKVNGNPCITKLPFVLQVIERVDIIDQVSDKHFSNQYAYHHGFFDTYEREFRGFGMVEQWDTESYEIQNEVTDIPPTYTKTWFHTGFFNRKDKIL
ncbi:MAG: toxin TcdB middle/N-terminal domain-containing protein [Bacteroidales bacterium]